MATQGEIQALRADIAALERDQTQQRRELAARLERLNQPDSEIRRELAQTMATTEEMRVELQTLRGQVEELQFRNQGGSGASAEMSEILADKVAELETRLLNLEQRVDPQLAATLPPISSGHSEAPPNSLPSSAPTEQNDPTSAKETSVQVAKPSERTQPTMPLPSSPPASTTGQPDVAAERLYERAKKEYNARNYEVAAVLFKQLLRDYPQNSLAGNAQYWLGETFYAQRQYEAAIVAFDEVIQKYGENGKVPASMLKQGYAFAALDDDRNARFFLEQVQRKFPDSEEAKHAGDKLKTLK
jgi:tol-pal system protein YbgF